MLNKAGEFKDADESVVTEEDNKQAHWTEYPNVPNSFSGKPALLITTTLLVLCNTC
jgi:hypothetical protein